MSEISTYRCQCGQKLQFKAEQAGKKFKCPACGYVFTLPTQDIDDFIDEFVEQDESDYTGESFYDSAQPPLQRIKHHDASKNNQEKRESVRRAVSNLSTVITLLFVLNLIGFGILYASSESDESRFVCVVALITSLISFTVAGLALALMNRITILLCDIHAANHS